MATAQHQIGDRVGLNGKNGTIQFVGLTQFASGEWVGVELDMPVGKNGGSVSGVQYFSCAPGHGLFVRKERIDKKRGAQSNQKQRSKSDSPSSSSSTPRVRTPRFTDSAYGAGTKGLRNVGNSCFMNASLQCIIALWPVLQRSLGSNLPPCGRLGTSLLQLLRSAWESSEKVLDPTSFLKEFGRRHPEYLKRKQQDAQEFVLRLIEEVSRESTKLAASEGRHTSESGREAPSTRSILSPLCGEMVSSVRCCHCGCESNRFEKLTTLSLLIPPSIREKPAAVATHARGKIRRPVRDAKIDTGQVKVKKTRSAVAASEQKKANERGTTLENAADTRSGLEQCLDFSTRGEPISEYQCDTCKARRQAERLHRVATPPPILCLHICRFQANARGTMSKINALVSYPETLDLSPYRWRGLERTADEALLPAAVNPPLGLLPGGSIDEDSVAVPHLSPKCAISNTSTELPSSSDSTVAELRNRAEMLNLSSEAADTSSVQSNDGDVSLSDHQSESFSFEYAATAPHIPSLPTRLRSVVHEHRVASDERELTSSSSFSAPADAAAADLRAASASSQSPVDPPAAPRHDSACSPAPEEESCSSSRYRLQGLIVHAGGSRGGHYTAYVRHPRKRHARPEFSAGDVERTECTPRHTRPDAERGRGETQRATDRDEESDWVYCTDARIRRTNQSEVLSRQAYILFYVRE